MFLSLGTASSLSGSPNIVINPVGVAQDGVLPLRRRMLVHELDPDRVIEISQIINRVREIRNNGRVGLITSKQ